MLARFSEFFLNFQNLVRSMVLPRRQINSNANRTSKSQGFMYSKFFLVYAARVSFVTIETRFGEFSGSGRRAHSRFSSSFNTISRYCIALYAYHTYVYASTKEFVPATECNH